MPQVIAEHSKRKSPRKSFETTENTAVANRTQKTTYPTRLVIVIDGKALPGLCRDVAHRASAALPFESFVIFVYPGKPRRTTAGLQGYAEFMAKMVVLRLGGGFRHGLERYVFVRDWAARRRILRSALSQLGQTFG